MPPTILSLSPEIHHAIFQNLGDDDLKNLSSIHSRFNGPARRLYPSYLEIRPDNALAVNDILTARSTDTWLKSTTLSTSIQQLTIRARQSTESPRISSVTSEDSTFNAGMEESWSVFFGAVYSAFRHHFTCIKELKLVQFNFAGTEKRNIDMLELMNAMGCSSPSVERLWIVGCSGTLGEDLRAILQPGLARDLQSLEISHPQSGDGSIHNFELPSHIDFPLLTTLKLGVEETSHLVAWAMIPTLQASSITTLVISQDIRDTAWNAPALQRVVNAVSATLSSLRLRFDVGDADPQVDLSLCQVSLSDCRRLIDVTVDIDQRLYGPSTTWLDQSRAFNIFSCLRTVQSRLLQRVHINAQVTARTDRPFVYRYSWDRFDEFISSRTRFPLLTCVQVSIQREVYPMRLPLEDEAEELSRLPRARHQRRSAASANSLLLDDSDDELVFVDEEDQELERQRMEDRQNRLVEHRWNVLERYANSKALSNVQSRFSGMLPICATGGILKVDFESRFVRQRMSQTEALHHP